MKKKLILVPFITLGLCSSVFASTNKQITFETDVLPVCGVIIEKSDGSIKFDDTVSKEPAKVTVKTNSKKGHATLSFNSINPTDNIKNQDGFFEVGKNRGSLETIDWKNPKSIDVKHDEEQEVFAVIPKNSSSITSGLARVTTTLEVSCN